MKVACLRKYVHVEGGEVAARAVGGGAVGRRAARRLDRRLDRYARRALRAWTWPRYVRARYGFAKEVRCVRAACTPRAASATISAPRDFCTSNSALRPTATDSLSMPACG